MVAGYPDVTSIIQAGLFSVRDECGFRGLKSLRDNCKIGTSAAEAALTS
jgi:hypothetical protein